MICLSGLLPEEIYSHFNILEKYRSLQIFKWISSGIQNFDDMKNIPQILRNELAKESVIRSSKITEKLVDPDGTVKLQIELNDKQCIETVLLIDKHGRKTACVSCQVGCAMKCAFCMTGTLGFTRNLTVAEIVEQFFHLEDECGKLDNIVFMGMGEPMLNLNEIRKSIQILTHEKGRNLSGRRITISTSGIISGIYDLADNGPKVRLAISLTCANDKLRSELMPVNISNPLSKLKEAIKYFSDKTHKRVTLEITLIHQINTNNNSINELKNFIKGLNVHINLIAWNPVKNLPFLEPTTSECNNYIAQLENSNINVTLRKHRGRKISGACGQLGKTKII
ncbi:MAG: 23S rRNA (adenine(2503)-C(2))-methyltransferase RlmN [Treponema sp.]|nr:23S rRNA (adenine(2503)-C(2))-methyltransferase RlmN [Treponema sp.]